MQPATPEAFQLLMEGSQALADVESYGMRIDVEYLDRTIEETKQEIQRLKEELREDEVWGIWERRFKRKADFGKREQLAAVFYEDLGYEVRDRSDKTGKAKTDTDALAHIKHSFLKSWNWIQKLEKCLSTYLIGIRRETVDGIARPFTNLHTVQTYRPSATQFNYQNITNREPETAKLVRPAFIPRDGNLFVEVDMSSHEFRGCGFFWKDPKIIDYASNPELNIHRDIAMKCYKLDMDEWTKESRQEAKNKFVFPTLYGSYWKNTGRDLWEAIWRNEMATKQGLPLYDHLKKKGISSQDQFVQHVKKVEYDFRDEFSHWDEQKDIWWDQYLKRGWFPLLSGFACKGKYSYNNLQNTPIQGPCFHIVLWSGIQINREIKRRKMGSRLLGTIHDSWLADVPKGELFDFVGMCQRIMTREVREHWPWVCVELEIEVDYSSRSWYHKKSLDLSLIEG